MRNPYFIFFFLLLVTFSSFSSAANVLVSVFKEQDIIEAGGEAHFTLIIRNNNIRDDTFQVKIDDFAVFPFSDVVERVAFKPYSLVVIPAGQEKEVTVVIKFLETVKVNRNYITEATVKSLTDPKIITRVDLSAYVISPRDVVTITLDIPPLIIPSEKEMLKVKFVNKGSSPLENLHLFYTSPIFNREDSVSLQAFESVEKELILELEPSIKPGKYSLVIRLFEGDDMKGSQNFFFTVGENPKIKESEEVHSGFLRSTLEIIRKNEGNTPVKKNVKYPLGSFSRWFTEVEPEGTLGRNEKGMYYEWDFTIPPSESYRITVTTDYKIPFFLVVAILLFLGVIFYLIKRDLTLTKTVFKVSEHMDTGVVDLKILLHVKNRSEKELYNVKIIDFVPRLFKKPSHFGTLEPSSIQEGTMGLRLLWTLPKIEARDEIVITYKISPHSSFVRKFTLPSATAQFYGRTKQVVNVKSKRLIYW